jgi:thioredoxin 1
MALKHTNDHDFKKDVLEEKLPVLVDFSADWCGPCRVLTPIVEDLAKEYHGKMHFVKINVDDSPQVASKYSIMSIPTLMFFKDGKVSEQIVGALSKPQLKAKILAHL